MSSRHMLRRSKRTQGYGPLQSQDSHINLLLNSRLVEMECSHQSLVPKDYIAFLLPHHIICSSLVWLSSSSLFSLSFMACPSRAWRPLASSIAAVSAASFMRSSLRYAARRFLSSLRRLSSSLLFRLSKSL